MKKLILATAASLALAFSVSAQTASYSADQLKRAASKSAEQKATAAPFTETPAVKPVAKTTAVVSTPATTTTAVTPATTTMAPVAATPATVGRVSTSTPRVNFNKAERPSKPGPGATHQMPNGRVAIATKSTTKAPVTNVSKPGATK